jgi:hypothetical protein
VPTAIAVTRARSFAGRTERAGRSHRSSVSDPHPAKPAESQVEDAAATDEEPFALLDLVRTDIGSVASWMRAGQGHERLDLESQDGHPRRWLKHEGPVAQEAISGMNGGMRVTFDLDGRPELDAAEALGVAELLADHQLGATLKAAIEIREAVIAEQDPDTPPILITLDADERLAMLAVLNDDSLVMHSSGRVVRLREALARGAATT